MPTDLSDTSVAGPSTAAEEFEQRKRSPINRIQHLLLGYPWLGPAAVLLLAIIAFGIINPNFVEPTNLSLVVQQVAVIATLGLGQTLIILTAGIDLSVGAAMILVTMVMGSLASAHGVPGPLALLIGLVLGFGCGVLNGVLVTTIKLPPFIVTLGTLSVFTALSLILSGGQSIDGDSLGSLLNWTGTAIPVGQFRITTGVLVMLVLYAVVAFALGQTAWGRHVYAVGDDSQAARLSGIRTSRVLFSVYATAGVIFALAAWILIGRTGSASPNAAVDANLDSITAVVIGGTSLFGGRGVVVGTLLGALIVGVFRSGLALAGVNVQYQTLAVGILVIAAVAIDRWIRGVSA
ncbi:MAG TPA: ABC transporter permease [Gordonia polyisoprenivorans]|uniref:ABC transporter permease n=2 Tax=Gordonia TaxID=2053 RepID=UPI000EC2E406|nr:ABC transporter permease [Gordonia polyisoprenivorans]UZF55341.1 ABC transporter permease [Gordonia polyisoprenivorans]WCB36509.1 ABC transporter permease [Gordonia polyisoprenivorans]HCS56556.1 ABC transporter permease [Gordonia polyisoprenivorans]